MIFPSTLSGLGDSSVSSLPITHLACSSDVLAVNLICMKGHMDSDEPMVSYDVNKDYPDSPLDLLHRWSYMRQTLDRYFALRGEPLGWKEGEPCPALRIF